MKEMGSEMSVKFKKLCFAAWLVAGDKKIIHLGGRPLGSRLLAALLAALLLSFAPASAFALGFAQVKPAIIKTLGHEVPEKYLTKVEGELTNQDALRLAFESMGWGFAIKAIDQTALLPEWPDSEGIQMLASGVRPAAPQSLRAALTAPLTEEGLAQLTVWLTECKKEISFRTKFDWQGMELILIKRGIGNPEGSANGDLKAGKNEPLFAALLAVDMKQIPCQIATAVMVGAHKAPLATIAAENYGVAGGINGGYFGGSKPIGVLRRQGYNDNVNFWPNRSAFGWNSDGESRFIDGKTTASISGSHELDRYTEMLQAGPLLIKNGAPSANTEKVYPNVLNSRHPRTFVGSDGKRVYWGVVDGRDKMHSVGMTIEELRRFCQQLKLTDALNLDGGGSSSLWWRGMTFTLPSNSNDAERPIPYAVLMFEPGSGVRN